MISKTDLRAQVVSANSAAISSVLSTVDTAVKAGKECGSCEVAVGDIDGCVAMEVLAQLRDLGYDAAYRPSSESAAFKNKIVISWY